MQLPGRLKAKGMQDVNNNMDNVLTGVALYGLQVADTTLYNSAGFSGGQQRAEGNNNEELLYIFVRCGDVYKKVAWKDVVYLRSEQHYTCLYNAGDKQEYLIRASLQKTMQGVMPASVRANFVQINRAEAVQLSYITEFSINEVKTICRTMVLSEGFGRQLRARITCIS